MLTLGGYGITKFQNDWTILRIYRSKQIMSPEGLRDKTNQKELVEILARRCANDGANNMAEGLNFYRHSSPTQPTHGVYSPSICIIAQGAKEVQLGEEIYRYDPAHFLLCSLDVPVVTQVVEATSARPYLGLKLEFDPTLIASVSVEAGIAPGRNDSSVKS